MLKRKPPGLTNGARMRVNTTVALPVDTAYVSSVSVQSACSTTTLSPFQKPPSTYWPGICSLSFCQTSFRLGPKKRCRRLMSSSRGRSGCREFHCLTGCGRLQFLLAEQLPNRGELLDVICHRLDDDHDRIREQHPPRAP